MSILQFILYFVLGGSIVCLVTYLGTTGKGFWAAFFGMLPVISLVTLGTIYYQAGLEQTINYGYSLIIMTVPLLLYISVFTWFLPYLGLVPAICIALALYVASSFALNWIRRM